MLFGLFIFEPSFFRNVSQKRLHVIASGDSGKYLLTDFPASLWHRFYFDNV